MSEEKNSVKVDITSTAVEKGLDAAKEFLDKVIGPALEETGLLISNPITLFRFKQQVKILNKAKIYCEKNKISPKVIPLKLLCPLLDFASLEEDEYLEDKWAKLLGNMVDSAQNIESHVFPYILSQISKDEFTLIEKTYMQRVEILKEHDVALKKHLKRNKDKLLKLYEDKKPLDDKIERLENQGRELKDPELYETYKKRYEIKDAISQIEYKADPHKNAKYLLSRISNGLKDYEISNLVRLGLVLQVNNDTSLKALSSPDEWSSGLITFSNFNPMDLYLTKLGEVFIEACIDKKAN